MTGSHQFNITLPRDIAEIIEKKIESGAYTSVDDVVVDSVRGLLEQDAAMERWLQTEIVAGHAEYIAEPSQSVPAEEILDRIRTRRATGDHS